MSITFRHYTAHPVYLKLHSKRQRPHFGHVQACLCGAFSTHKHHQYSPKKCQYRNCSNHLHVVTASVACLIATPIPASTTLLVVVVVVVTLALTTLLATVTTLLATVTTLLATVTSLHTLRHHGVTATIATLLTIPSTTHTLLTIPSTTTHTLLTIATAASTCIACKLTEQYTYV